MLAQRGGEPLKLASCKHSLTTIRAQAAMPMNSSKDGIGRTDALALGLLALAVLATRSIWFGDPVADYDEQLYSFIGARLLEGELPFVDWWDRKPFGLFALYALAHALFGPGPLAYQVLAAGFAVAASWLTYALARKLVDRATACLAGLLVAVLLPLYSSHSGQSEVFFAPLMLAMLWLLAEPAHPRWRAAPAHPPASAPATAFPQDQATRFGLPSYALVRERPRWRQCGGAVPSPCFGAPQRAPRRGARRAFAARPLHAIAIA